MQLNKRYQGCNLGDGAVKIFINTKGKNADEVSEELIEFLKYVEHTTEVTANQAKSERVRRVHDRVCKVLLFDPDKESDDDKESQQ